MRRAVESEQKCIYYNFSVLLDSNEAGTLITKRKLAVADA